MSRYAIGDVQGCMESLERLLALLRFDPSVDEAWLVGDLVNRGPRSLDVLRWAKAHERSVRCVLGNHDLHLLARAAGAPPKKRDTLDEILSAPDREELLAWVRGRPLLYVDDPWVLVHAGLHPSWSVPQARSIAAEIEAELVGPSWSTLVTALGGPVAPWRPELVGLERWRSALAYLVRVRACYADGRVEPSFDGPPSEAPAGTKPWFLLEGARWRTHVPVFGHWAALGLSIGPGHVALDSGCVWGNRLTALRLEDRAIFQVEAAEGRG